MSVLVFDTETTGLVLRDQEPEHQGQPDLVQIAALLLDGNGVERAAFCSLVKPSRAISDGARKAHGIDGGLAGRYGLQPAEALPAFAAMVARADVIVAHNLTFDALVLRTAWHRTFSNDFRSLLVGKRAFCTMKAATPICKILSGRSRHSRDYKWPKLSECIEFFFAEKLVGAHDALVDSRACARVYFEIQKRRAQEKLLASENLEQFPDAERIG